MDVNDLILKTEEYRNFLDTFPEDLLYDLDFQELGDLRIIFNRLSSTSVDRISNHLENALAFDAKKSAVFSGVSFTYPQISNLSYLNTDEKIQLDHYLENAHIGAFVFLNNIVSDSKLEEVLEDLISFSILKPMYRLRCSCEDGSSVSTFFEEDDTKKLLLDIHETFTKGEKIGFVKNGIFTRCNECGRDFNKMKNLLTISNNPSFIKWHEKIK